MNLSLLFTTVLLAFSASAAEGPKCSLDQKCPEEYPCCSSEGICGTGSYCQTSCDPRNSFHPSSCKSAPICKSGLFIPRTDNMMDQLKYYGDADFTYYGPIEDTNNSVRIKMFPYSVGGTISSSFYVWYGKVSVKFKASHSPGVISSFSLASQVLDEIDYTFFGSDLSTTQTNFNFQGDIVENNELKISLSNTSDNWHTYTIDWTEDRIQWLIDNQLVRTLKKADTWNKTSQVYEFPQTPSRIELSIKPANGPTTKDLDTIDWNSPDFEDLGYSYVEVDTVEVECYVPPSYAIKKVAQPISYSFDKNGFLSENVQLSDRVPSNSLDRKVLNNNKNLDEVKSRSISNHSSSTRVTKPSSRPPTRSRRSRSKKSSALSTSTSLSSTSSSSLSSTTRTGLSFSVTGFIQDIHTLGSSSTIKNNAQPTYPNEFSLLFAMLSLLF